MPTRRTLLKHGGLLAAGAAVVPPRWLSASAAVPLFPEGYPDRNAIINAAVQSAIAAGASYADARLSHQELLAVAMFTPGRQENMAFGVRVLYQGYWGFAASPVWSKEEGARLGQAAVAQAKANVLGRERITELAPIAGITEGHWETPITDDPFKIDSDELLDFTQGLLAYMGTLKYMGSINSSFQFSRINKAFGSSSNQFTTQILYTAESMIAFGVRDKLRMAESGAIVEDLSIAGAGFEYFRDRPVREYIRKAHEEAIADLDLPVRPIDVGRYDILIDQHGVANLLAQSIGTATEIDRVFGYEANAGGTSYINEPEVMLGTLKIGAPRLNVTADRSQPGSVGRVRWDDEGVEPVKYDLIKDGLLVNFQTNREGATWIPEHYKRTSQPLRSFGTANSSTALDVPLVHKSDLSMTPDNTTATWDDLRVALDKGIELRTPGISLDFQQSTGFSQGKSYEIKNGKRVARYLDAGMLFRTLEIWNNLTRIGGTDSVKYNGIRSTKGQPQQQTACGVYTPPATFKEMTFVDVKRKG